MAEMKSLNGYEIVDEAARARISLLEETGGRSAYDIAVENGFEGSEEEWLESLPGKDGEDGYSVVGSVARQFTSAQWNTYGTVGHVENWAGTSCDGVAVGDLFFVMGLATDTGEGHMLVYQHTAEKNSYQLNGKCIAHHVIASRGAKGDPGNDYILTEQDKQDIAEYVDVPSGIVWTNLGVVDDVVAEMDGLVEEGFYRLSDGEFTYSLKVETPDDRYVAQEYWGTEEQRHMLYFRMGYYWEDGELEWFDWDSHATWNTMQQFAPKNHNHLTKSNQLDFLLYLTNYTSGQQQITVVAEGKSYISEQYNYTDISAKMIYYVQQYWEIHEPWKVHFRTGSMPNKAGSKLTWDEWVEVDYSNLPGDVSVTQESIEDALGYTPADAESVDKKLDAYIVSGTFGEEDGEYFVTIDDDFDWDDMLAAINANHYVGCILHHVDGSGVSLRLALASTWPEDGYMVFTALDEGVRAYDMYLNSGADAVLVWRQLATMEDVENASGGAELTRESIESALGYTPADADEVAMYTHNHSASAITSGTLGSARLPTVPITKGGTGATTAAAARTSLGITPANIGAALEPIVSTTDITAGSTASDGRPYHVIE